MSDQWTGLAVSTIEKNQQSKSDPHFEKRLMDAFSAKEFIQAGKGSHCPKMLRGLPRLYHRNCPAQSHIKHPFADLPALRRIGFAKALFSQYSRFEPGSAELAIVKPKEESEAWLAKDLTTLLKERFPALKIEFQEEGVHLPRGYGHFESTPLGTDSLGLHFLEKGVLTWKPKPAAVTNQLFNQWFCPEHRFYYADLISEAGTTVYLHALLKSLESDSKNIDFCIPDATPLFQYIEQRQKHRLPLFPEEMGIASLEIGFGQQKFTIGDEGKKIRVLCPDYISREDQAAFIQLSGEFVAIHTDLGFTDAISADKVYFYDSDGSQSGFLKDLHALAENRLASCLSALTLFRSMKQVLIHNSPPQKGEWVDESHFQEGDDLFQIAGEVAQSLTSPIIAAGYKHLNRVIREEFSANSYLIHLVQRALCHQKYPHLALLEEELLEDLAWQQRSLPETIQLFTVPAS